MNKKFLVGLLFALIILVALFIRDDAKSPGDSSGLNEPVSVSEDVTADLKLLGESLTVDPSVSYGGSADMPALDSVSSFENDLDANVEQVNNVANSYEAIIADDFATSYDAQKLEAMIRRLGSIKSVQLQLLQRDNQPLYEAWLARRFDAGFSDASRTAQTSAILAPLVKEVFNEHGMPEYFECSADMCISYMTTQHAKALMNSLGTGRMEMPVEFISVFSTVRQKDGSHRSVFVREDIDLSSYPDG